MPFFSHPANGDFLLPLVKIPLTLISLVFKLIYAMGPIGNILCIAIIIGLFSWNLLKPVKS